MRVVQLGAYPPPHGGLQTNVVAIRRYLLDHGHECSVINLTRHRDSRAANLYHPTNPFQVIKLLLSLKYDIIHLHYGGELSFRLLLLYLFCGFLPGKKTVLTCHSGGYPNTEEAQRARRLSFRGFVFRRLDRIIAVNQQLCEVFHRFGVPKTRIRLILPYAIKTPDVHHCLPDHIRDFFDKHQPCLLTVGLLEPEYDLPLQIDVMERVLAVWPQAGLVIIGSGSLRDELEMLVRSKPYSDRILLCNDVEHADTLCAIRDCDVLLRTTLYDGDAVSVREALHLGTPVIATDNRMRPEGVHLIQTHDADGLYTNLDQLLRSPAARPVVTAASGAENLQAVIDLYQELLGC